MKLGKVYVLEFSSLLVLLFVQNESKYVVDREEIFGNQISELYQSLLTQT
jgi:uncharacterized membrane protein affecting hemolysin expression